MKESEAKTKTCPDLFIGHSILLLTLFAMRNAGIDVQKSADKFDDSSEKCVGSACMMWEPEYERQEAETPYNTPSPPGDIDGSNLWAKTINSKYGPDGERITVWSRYVPTDSGDCGLKSKHLECGQ